VTTSVIYGITTRYYKSQALLIHKNITTSG